MGEFASFSTSRSRFPLMCCLCLSRCRFLPQTEQYFCRGLTSRLPQSRHILIACCSFTLGLAPAGRLLKYSSATHGETCGRTDSSNHLQFSQVCSLHLLPSGNSR